MTDTAAAAHNPPHAQDPLDRHTFPADPWALTETSYDPWHLGRNETLFAVGNGYLGMRGNVEEGRESFAHGTFVNGFHETFKIQHAEEAFGFARVGQTMVNVPEIVDRPQIVVRTSIDEVQFDEFDRWADSLKSQIRRVIVADLAAQFPGGMVYGSQGAVDLASAYQVSIEIQSFESAPADAAAISMLWSSV